MREAAEDEAQRRRYMDGWRKAAVGRPMQSQPTRVGYPNHGYQPGSGGGVVDRKRDYAVRPDYRDERPYRYDGRYH